MLRIKIGEQMALSQLKSKHTSCSYCGKYLDNKRYYLTIRKMCASGTPVQVWMHIHCLKKANRDLNKILKDENLMAKLIASGV